MRTPQDRSHSATNLAELARELVSQDWMPGALDSIVGHAASRVEGCDAASIMTISNGSVETLACAGPVERIAERIQSEGPWADLAIRGQGMYRIEDTYAADTLWRDFAQRARELGIGSMMGFLFHTDRERGLGGLELYAGSRGAFDRGCEHAGWVLAAHAAVALANDRHAASLDDTLTSARTIGEAIGIVRCRYGLSNQAALQAIRRASHELEITVRDLAEDISANGELPPYAAATVRSTPSREAENPAETDL